LPGSINDSGDALGTFYDLSGQEHAFVRDLYGNFTVFDAPNAISGTGAVKIDNAGEIAGQFQDGTEKVWYGNGWEYKARAFLRLPSDTKPPITTATPSPSPNSYGWNNTNVTINLSSTDNPSGSGVKQIEYALGGAQNTGWTTVAGNTDSVTISAEGTTVLSYAATDNAGNRETTKTLTVKIDKTPPVISGMPTTGCVLWPVTRKLVQVATVTAADALSGLTPGSFKLTGTSNEPSDPYNPDIVITPNGTGGYVVQLRADRLATGAGRVYTLNATASDLAGNVTTKQATCSVPHDQGI
jgi:hypothetical protein